MLVVNRFREVARIQQGGTFGELALLKNTGRAATVICSKKARLATLHQRDYTQTLGQMEKLQNKKIVAFFRGFRIFANLRATYIEKVVKHMKIIQFKRGQKVYTEGQSGIDGIFFIIAGDFQVS